MRPRWIWSMFISVSCFIQIASNYCKDTKGDCWSSNLWLLRGARMVECQIASLECMPSCSAGSLPGILDWIGSKAVSITASKFFLSSQMVHGGRRKSTATKKYIGNYQDGCIICLKSFSVGCVSLAKKRNDFIVCSTCYSSFFVILIDFFMGTCFLC